VTLGGCIASLTYSSVTNLASVTWGGITLTVGMLQSWAVLGNAMGVPILCCLLSADLCCLISACNCSGCAPSVCLES
jgi:hypothetical protein